MTVWINCPSDVRRRRDLARIASWICPCSGSDPAQTGDSSSLVQLIPEKRNVRKGTLIICTIYHASTRKPLHQASRDAPLATGFCFGGTETCLGAQVRAPQVPQRQRSVISSGASYLCVLLIKIRSYLCFLLQ